MAQPKFTVHGKFVKGLTGLGIDEAEAEKLIAAGYETPKKAKAAGEKELKAAGLPAAKAKGIKERGKPAATPEPPVIEP